MRHYTLNEVFRLTRYELFALHAEIVAQLAQLPDASPERAVAFANLRLIRRALSRHGPSP